MQIKVKGSKENTMGIETLFCLRTDSTTTVNFKVDTCNESAFIAAKVKTHSSNIIGICKSAKWNIEEEFLSLSEMSFQRSKPLTSTFSFVGGTPTKFSKRGVAESKGQRALTLIPSLPYSAARPLLAFGY